MTNQVLRRDFLKRAGAAAPLLMAGPFARAAGANDRIRAAVIGLGGRGRDHMRLLAQIPDVEVVTFCDPDENQMRQKASEFESATGKRPKLVPDVRSVLEDRDIDVITIAACNHWHALATVWACQAGKHVYVEKPVSHDIVEGQKMVEAARKYNRIVQAGTQRRSSDRFRKAIALLHSGAIGDVYLGRWLFTGPRDSIGFREPEPPPPNLHWDLWLGPAPEQRFNRNLVHYNWHWFWDFGNGEIGNNGVHSMDILRWGMQKGLPSRIQSLGGRFGYKDQAQTPNTQSAQFEYADGTMILCEIRGLYSNEQSGMHFYGSKGSLHLDQQGNFEIFLGRATKPDLQSKDMGDPDQMEVGHFSNFLSAVRANDRRKLTCDIAEGDQSTALCHLANISYRLKRELRFDPASRRFLGDAEADALLSRAGRAPFRIGEAV